MVSASQGAAPSSGRGGAALEAAAWEAAGSSSRGAGGVRTGAAEGSSRRAGSAAAEAGGSSSKGAGTAATKAAKSSSRAAGQGSLGSAGEQGLGEVPAPAQVIISAPMDCSFSEEAQTCVLGVVKPLPLEVLGSPGCCKTRQGKINLAFFKIPYCSSL